ncbi:hypothetical protein FNQ90_03330 [Streptomyces alkaliphilus]|uniref:Uncharacterized protein n=1 Tax=Streptomyces alkaliphilus TaxID=1472722 RepID=A0A7W3TA97_9ACTN|nr:hypothetical protein [Streptomyces alkaliphilus]MBB0243168.1 hypothetical protein [Streptomyces alkaliphilus]
MTGRILLAELRHSSLRWAWPVLVAIDLFALFGRSDHWIGVWSETGAAAQVPAFYLGPAMAALAAWTAARRRRENAGGWMDAAARPAPLMECVHLGTTLAHGVTAYGVGVIAAVAVTLPGGGPHFFWPGYVLLGLVVIVLCTGVGHAVGRAGTSLVAAPLGTALVLFVLFSFFGFVPQGAEWGLGLMVVSGYPDVVTAAGPMLARSALALAVVLVAVAVGRGLRSTPGRPGWPGVPVAALAACGFLAVSVVGFATAGPVLQQRGVPDEPLCTSHEPRVCLWPESRKYLEEAELMSRRVAALPADLFTSPAAFHETGLRGETTMGSGFYIREGEMWEVATSLAIRIQEVSTPPHCDAVTFDEDEKRWAADMELISWLTARIAGGGKPPTVNGGPPGVDEKAVHSIITEPEEVQVAWAEERLATIRDTRCV